MEHLLKQFEDWGIAFRHNLFLKARLKLMALYVMTVAVIVCAFSLFLFISISHNLSDAGDDDFANSSSRTHFIDNTLAPIRTTLIFTDLSIILSAAALSYWLAGRTLKPVERSLEAQRLFAANASHELRTPLAVMKNDSEVTLRDKHASATELRSALTSNIEEIQKMSRLVEDLLVLARSEHAQLPSISRVNIAELQEEVISKLLPLADRKGVTLTSSVQGVVRVRGNKQALERILVNLIQNSIEHTPIDGRIEVSTKIDAGEVSILVHDTGVGIAAEDLPNIFERFYKGRMGDEKNGSGLGLAIVKEIVIQHEGSISVESIEHKGTDVLLHFPAG
jgi:signal transduction histidine kinase